MLLLRQVRQQEYLHQAQDPREPRQAQQPKAPQEHRLAALGVSAQDAFDWA